MAKNNAITKAPKNTPKGPSNVVAQTQEKAPPGEKVKTVTEKKVIKTTTNSGTEKTYTQTTVHKKDGSTAQFTSTKETPKK